MMKTCGNCEREFDPSETDRGAKDYEDLYCADCGDGPLCDYCYRFMSFGDSVDLCLCPECEVNREIAEGLI